MGSLRFHLSPSTVTGEAVWRFPEPPPSPVERPGAPQQIFGAWILPPFRHQQVAEAHADREWFCKP
jgi:hypothetical protein